MNFNQFITEVDNLVICYDKISLSTKALTSVIEHDKLCDFSKVLMLHFMTYKATTLGAFIVFPSHEFLCKKFNASKTTISNAIKNLKDHHMISVMYDSNGRKFKRKNFYLLIPLVVFADVDRYLTILKQYFDFNPEEVSTTINSYRFSYSSEKVEP